MLLLIVSACSSALHQPLIGVWKSDAARTLESMQGATNLTPAARAEFEDDYYGHVIVEYRLDTVRAWFDNRSYDSGYQPYTVIEATDDYIVTREWNEVTRRFEETTTYLDGDCIYGIAAEYGFREYYCPCE